MKLLLMGVFVALGFSQTAQDLPPWILQLSRIKRHLRPNFERMPNYMCLETVNRFEKAPNGRDFRLIDTIRLDIAVSENQEVMSLAGGARLEADVPAAVRAEGAFGTGSFSALARNLFVNDSGRTTGWAEERFGDRAVLRYDFEIPQMVSGYKVTSGTAEAIVGEKGSYWVDAGTFDLLRVEESATDIPPTIPMREVKTNITYSKVQIGASEVTLPQSAEMTIVNFDGRRHRNVMDFSGCREYGSESKISFGNPQAPATVDVTLPPPPPKKK